MSNTDTRLKIDNVCLSYGNLNALKNVNAEIKKNTIHGRGNVVGFLGPSGCGKTTLFRIIAGLNKADSGKVTINGEDEPVQAGRVGVVAQSYPLFEHRTIFSNLMLAAKKREKNTQIAKEKVVALLHEFELGDKGLLYPASLSGGQRQRAAILQQILCSEHFLLMDEPFSGLDLTMLEKTSALICRIAGMDDLNTLLIVTHDVTAAASVADHLWLMGRDVDSEGRKIQGSRIVKEYNLIERDLCWHEGIQKTPRFTDFVLEVKEEFRKL